MGESLENEKKPKKSKLPRWAKTAAYGLAGFTLGYQGQDLPLKRHLLIEQLTQSEESDAVLEATLRFIKETYGVDVGFGDMFTISTVSAKTVASLEEKKTSLKYLLEEIGKYPPDFFTRNKLPHIRIVSNIEIGGSIFNLFRGKEIGGVADLLLDTVFLNFSGGPKMSAEIMHHEIYHILDYRDNGFHHENKQWESMHVHCKCLAYNTANHEGDPRLHAREYGAQNPIEDRATFAEALLIPEQYAALMARITSETSADVKAVLEQKVAAIKADYARWSTGNMNESFWEKIHEQGKIALARESSYTYDDLDLDEWMSEQGSYGWETYYDSDSYEYTPPSKE